MEIPETKIQPNFTNNKDKCIIVKNENNSIVSKIEKSEIKNKQRKPYSFIEEDV